MQLLDLANFLAKYSCPKWNKNRILRKVCRVGYQRLSQNWIRYREAESRRPIRLRSPRKFPRLDHAIEPLSEDWHNTYPWPYRDEGFADWEEDDSPEGYNLISDPAGFVIRHSTSYCAWRIREATGHWPMNRGSERQRFDAKNWEEFLSLNHGQRVTDNFETEMSFMPSLYCYIGVLPEQGEFGQVVCLDAISVSFHEKVRHLDYLVSTYEDQCYRRYYLSNREAAEIIWMKIHRC